MFKAVSQFNRVLTAAVVAAGFVFAGTGQVSAQTYNAPPAYGVTSGQSALPTNPWAGGVANQGTGGTAAPAPANTINGLPSNPWRGSGTSGDAGGPQYTGQTTTWNTAMGQEETAPEINVSNMLSMTQHLRNLGYEIPDSVDLAIRTAPAKLRTKIMAALKNLKTNSGDPISRVTSRVIGDAEDSSGLSTENLLGNSLDLLSSE